MAVTSNTPTAMTAAVELVVDKQKLNREIAGASNSVSQGLRGLEQGASRQVSQAMTKTVSDITGKVKEMSDKISAVLNVPMKFGMSAGGGAIAAFLRSSTSEANQFKARLAEVQTALGGVGQKLVMNVKFGGQSGYEWAKKLAEYLEGLDVSQLQKAADIIKNIAFTIAGLKGISLGADLLKSGSQALQVLNSLRGASAAAGAAQGLSGLATAGLLGGGAGGAVLASRAKGITGLPGPDFSISLSDTSGKAREALLKSHKATQLIFDSIDKVILSGDKPLNEAQRKISINKMHNDPGVVGASEEYLAQSAKWDKYSRVYGFEKARAGQSFSWRLGSGYAESGIKGIGTELAKGGAQLAKSWKTLALGVGKFAAGAAIFAAASKFAEYGIKKGVQSFQREQSWLKKATGQGMFSLGGGDEISTWRAVRENGLYTDNWFDRLMGGKDPHRGMETNYSAEETKAALAENARLRAEQKKETANAGLYRKGTAFGRYLSETNIDFAKEDAARTTDLDYKTASKRTDAYTYIKKEAEELAAQFKALRDGVTYGTAAYDTYNKSYVDNIQQAIAAIAELARIEKLGTDEKNRRIEADKALARLRADYTEDDNDRNDARVDARAQMNKQVLDLKERLEELKKGRPSMSLGIGAAQMPEFRAYQMKDVMDAKDEYAKATAETLERLEELELERRKRQGEWDKAEERRKKALDESIQRIEEAVTGKTAGSPVQ